MKRFRILLCMVLALVLLLPCLPKAAAEEPEVSEDDARFADKTWDELVEELLEKWGTDSEHVTLAYYNTVTGEEHYVNPDKYMITGSMYKIPLNMLFLERISDGELQWDSLIAGIKYEDLLEKTIVQSSNDCARILWKQFPSYHNYRERIAPYMGEDPETVDPKFYENNFFTARQMLHCLKVLYENQDRYPRLIESMQRAQPDNYFKRDERRFDIAHKYGYLVEGYRLYMNDCAICFTDDPILIVMFTDGCVKAYEIMAEYPTLMCDYTQYHTAIRVAEEKAEADRQAALSREAAEKAAQEAERIKEEAPDGEIPGEILAQPEEPATASARLLHRAEQHGLSRTALIAGAAAILLTLVLFLVIVALGRKYRVRSRFALLAALLLCLGALLRIGLPAIRQMGTRPNKDPQDTVLEFLDALEQQDYPRACRCLDGVETLGLEHEPADESSLAIYQAMTHHLSGALSGDCRQDGALAIQRVEFQYFDVNTLAWNARSESMIYISHFAVNHPVSELYGEDGSYRPELLRESWDQAVEVMLLHPENYARTAGVQLELRWHDGAWHIVPSERLLVLLTGGVELIGEEAEA